MYRGCTASSNKASISFTRTGYPHRVIDIRSSEIEGLHTIGKPELRHIPYSREKR